MTKRKFNFPIATLVHQSGVLQSALTDPAHALTMAGRINLPGDTAENNFATRFKQQLDLVAAGTARQSGKTGEAATLTLQQTAHFEELERLTAGARRTSRLAFPEDFVKVRNEFQVGIDEPKTLAAELDRARIILAGCRRHAAELQKQGWHDRDTTALEEVIANLGETSLAQSEALNDRTNLTDEKVRAANTLYASALAIQNAARLEYPSNRPGTEGTRRRFLLDEFPPRDRSEPHGSTAPAAPPIPFVSVAPGSPAAPAIPAAALA